VAFVALLQRWGAARWAEGVRAMTTANDKRLSSPPQAQGRVMDWLYDAKLRGIASQILVVLLIIWGLYEIVANTQANLVKLNQNFGFDFLGKAAGFDLSTSLIFYSSNSTYGRALQVGGDGESGPGSRGNPAQCSCPGSAPRRTVFKDSLNATSQNSWSGSTRSGRKGPEPADGRGPPN
jgi:hypothetical protein